MRELRPALRSLHENVSRWRLLPALIMLSKLGWYEPPDPPNPAFARHEQWLEWHQHDLAYLAKVIVSRCDPYRGASQVKLDDIINAISESLEASEPAGYEGFDDPTKVEGFSIEALDVISRIAAAQWRLRFNYLHQMVRAIQMFHQIPERSEIALRLDWHEELQDLYGFTAQDIIVMLTGFRTNYTGGVVTRGNLVTYFQDSPYTESQVDQFLHIFSADPTQLTELASGRQKLPAELEYYAFPPLYEFPIVRVGPSRYVVPSKAVFVYALTSGLYWKLRNRFARLYESGKNPVDDDLGLLLETYARDVMDYYLDADEFVPEIEYEGGKWADAAILCGTEGIILECKAHGFSLDALSTGEIAAAQGDLEKNLVRGLTQVAGNLRRVADAAEVEPRLREITSWLPLVLVYEAPIPLNFPQVRESVLAQLSADDRNLVQNYQALTTNEFESLMTAARFIHPVELIKNKIKDEPNGLVRNFVIEQLQKAGQQPDESYFKGVLDDLLLQIEAKFEE